MNLDQRKMRADSGLQPGLAQDMIAIMQATTEVMQGMSEPLKIHNLRLKRVARYLQTYPGEIWHYNYQRSTGKLDDICDADWAGDVVTRKSVSCIVEKFGAHILDAVVAKQSTIALSSGEVE